MTEFAAVVLAGGAARRLGGITKPLVRVGGRPLLGRVLEAVSFAEPRVVVGPPELSAALPPDALRTQEDPAGGGPVAGIAAGVRLLPAHTTTVAVLSGDLPFLTRSTLADLAGCLREPPEADLAVLLDETGMPQWLCAVWRRVALERRLAAVDPPTGVRVRDLVGDATVRPLTITAPSGPPPWLDCDTEADIAAAKEWIHDDA